MTEWLYNDETIDDSEILYRRVPPARELRTFDPLDKRWVPSPAALRRDANEGMSSHLDSIVRARGRNPTHLYAEGNLSISFLAKHARNADAGVLKTNDPDEKDACLREAHAEVRPPTSPKDREFWKGVVNELIVQSRWVQGVELLPALAY